MPRYRTNGPLDDEPILDGDNAFFKFTSRRQSTILEPGTLEVSQNMRLNRTTAKVRAGLKSISTDLNLTNTPIVLDFQLAFDVAVTSITRSSSTATVTTTGAHGYATGNLVNIRGADQSEYNGDKTITVTNSTHFTYSVAGTPTTPATGTIFANAGPVVFTTYNDVAHCSCVFATNDNNNTEYVIVASTDNAWAIRGGVSSQSIAYPSNEQVASTDDASMTYWNGSVYIFRGYQTAAPLTVSVLSRSSTTATADTSAAHGLSSGDWVFVQGATPVNFNGIFQITVVDSDTFTYTVIASGATTATGTITARPSKPALVWDGNFSHAFAVVATGAIAATGTLIHMPPVAWGVDFKSRLVIPFSRDEVLLSDIYDANSYDTVFSELRIRGGTNDWLVGVSPYQDLELLIFYRRSIHLLDLSSEGLALASAQEITRDIGCVSRRSIATCGDRILWLSDRGVQSLTIGDLLALRQAARPISDDIEDIILRINYAYANTIVATYWDNRYYLAVPLDDSTTANAILVYNFINQGWESVDSYPAGFNVENFHQLAYNGAKRLHVSTTFGFVYLMEENNSDQWGTAGQMTPIIGALTTRYYIGATVEPKKVRRFTMETNLTDGDTFAISAATKNRDHVTSALTITADETTDKMFRLPYYGLFGTGAQLRITTSAGRPEFRNTQAEFQGLSTRGNYSLP